MSIHNRQDFDKWVRRCVIYVPNQDGSPGRCVKFEIRHLSIGNKMGNLVANVQVPTEIDDSAIDLLVNECESLAHMDAGALGGLQKYIVVPKYKDGSTLGRFAINMRPEEGASEEDNEIDSEPPTKQGHLSQLMRHNEALMRTVVMSTNQIVGMQQRTISRQAEQIEKHQEMHFNLVELHESLLSQKHERELATKQAEFKHDAIKDIAQKVSILLPTAVNRIAGRKLLPETTTPSEVLIKSILESITPIQFSALQGILKPEQTLALLDMMELYQRQKDSAAIDKETPSNGTGS